MTLKEVIALVNAGYTKSEIQAMAAPAAQTPAAAAPVVPMTPAAAPAAQTPAAVPRQPMTPGDVPTVTLSDVLGAVNQLAAKISTPAPAPAFGEPQPRGLNDLVSGYLGVTTAPNTPKQ